MFGVERLIEGEGFACAVVIEIIDGAAALVCPMLDLVAQLAADRGGKGDAVYACVLVGEGRAYLDEFVPVSGRRDAGFIEVVGAIEEDFGVVAPGNAVEGAVP